MSKNEHASLQYDGKHLDLPVLHGTIPGNVGIDIGSLRTTTGMVTFDNGFANTAAVRSAITYIDGGKGILRYRGYDIEDLARNCSFVEVAYLLVHGSLPTINELNRFSKYLNENSLIHENMQHFFGGYPADSHPMSILASMINSLGSFYPHLAHKDPNFDITAARLLSKIRTIAAFSFKKSEGDPIVYPRHDLSYCANFLNMMFSSPVKEYEIDPLVVRAMNILFILHADHEQNCSTTAVRLIGSARASLYAAISAGISALSGPLHGGANQSVIEMLNKIKNDHKNVKKYINRAKDSNSTFRLMGFGHAVYKNYDPRAKIIKEICDQLLEKLHISDPLLDTAKELEYQALRDDYFKEKKLYPNVDFYSGIVYRAIGFPVNMLTVLFTIGRLPGWIAHWLESRENPKAKIYRPRQIYSGPDRRDFTPINDRKREK